MFQRIHVQGIGDPQKEKDFLPTPTYLKCKYSQEHVQWSFFCMSQVMSSPHFPLSQLHPETVGHKLP